jgi:hypothetical protein
VIRQPSGIAAGVNVYLQTDQSYFETKNNRWEDNRYTLGEPMQTQFLWNNQVIDSELWLGFDHDMNGSFAELNE